MTTAAQKALAIPELLEAVLHELSPRDLILSQRVNTSFKTTIEKSKDIQQKLFFKHAPSNSETTDINPLLGRLFRYLSAECKIFVESRDRSMQRVRYERHIWEDAPSKYLRLDTATEQIVINLYKPIRKSKTNTDRQSSYEHMLTANSPVKVVVYRSSNFYHAVATADDAPIPTLGGLIEALSPSLVEAMEAATLN